VSMPKGFKSDKGYATVTEFPGSLDYRAISERMSQDGDKMNHSTARNVFLRAMSKLAANMHDLYDLDMDEKSIDRSAKDPEFQSGVYEFMIDLAEERGSSRG
jgi:hypothetical protein